MVRQLPKDGAFMAMHEARIRDRIARVEAGLSPTTGETDGDKMDSLDLMRANRVAQSTAYESECLMLATMIVQKHGGKGKGGHLIDRLIFLDAKLTALKDELGKTTRALGFANVRGDLAEQRVTELEERLGVESAWMGRVTNKEV